MQRAQDEDMFTSENLRNYYFRKVFRYIPLNVVALLTVFKLLPMVGSGPIWNYFKQLVNGCD